MHRRIAGVSSVFFLAAALTSALGCSSAGRDAAVSDSTASKSNASASTPAELELSGDFQGPLGVQLYSFREAFKTGGETHDVEFVPIQRGTLRLEGAARLTRAPHGSSPDPGRVSDYRWWWSRRERAIAACSRRAARRATAEQYIKG